MVYPYLSWFWHRGWVSKHIPGHEEEPEAIEGKFWVVQIEKRLLRFITFTNWMLFGLGTVCGFVWAPVQFALGILAGGLVVTVNFHLLYRSLRKTLTPPHIASVRMVLGKYYVRFAATGIIIFALIANHLVHPLGLIIGLSVVVTSIILATFNEIRKIIFKEAV